MDIQKQIAQKLIEARTSMGMSASAVADALGIVRQTYGKYEQGLSTPDVSQLIALCKIFDKPLGYFYDQDEGSFRFAMRADSPDLLDSNLRNELVEKLKNISAIEEAAEANQPEDLPSSMPLFSAKEEDLRLVEDKAVTERNRLGIGNATCVGDFVALLEASDIRVIPFSRPQQDDDQGMVWGFSAFSGKYGTAIYVNNHETVSVERQIFSICHEYAHLIFHREEYTGPARAYKTRGRSVSPEEKIANHFAACFLIPEAALRKQFLMQGGGWAYEETVMRLKRVFRVSASCIIDRLSKTGIINKRNSGFLWAMANKRGWLKCEPLPITEQLNYKGRLIVLSRKAWGTGSASESFIADLLEMDRKDLGKLIDGWYCEQEAEEDAF